MVKRATKAAVEKDATDVDTEQPYLDEEMAPAVIDELEDDAKERRGWVKKFKESQGKIQKLNNALLEKMIKHDQKRYVCRNTNQVIVREAGAEKLKVTESRAEMPDPDDD